MAGWRGVYVREGATPPLHNHSPSQTYNKRGLKDKLFERGPGGENLKSTKIEWNQRQAFLALFKLLLSFDNDNGGE